MFKWFAKKGVDTAFKALIDFVKEFFGKKDNDKDGKLDFVEEMPSLLKGIQSGVTQLIDCVDSSKLAEIGALATKLVSLVKEAVNVPRAQEAIEQIKADGGELLKLVKLTLIEFQKKDETKEAK